MAKLIPGLNLGKYNKYITPVNLLALSGLLIAGYIYFAKKAVVKLDFTVTPPTVSANAPTTVTIAGSFSSKVPEGYYYVYDINNNLVTSGSLGKDIDKFSKAIQIPAMPKGVIDIDVSDETEDVPVKGPTPQQQQQMPMMPPPLSPPKIPPGMLMGGAPPPRPQAPTTGVSPLPAGMAGTALSDDDDNEDDDNGDYLLEEDEF